MDLSELQKKPGQPWELRGEARSRNHPKISEF
jgi:hypothetical protein